MRLPDFWCNLGLQSDCCEGAATEVLFDVTTEAGAEVALPAISGTEGVKLLVSTDELVGAAFLGPSPAAA